MENRDHMSSERTCPVCNSRIYLPFADQRIDHEKINSFSYASRKEPEFMCLRLVQCQNCDVVYAPTPPTSDFLLNAYSDSAYDSGIEASAAAQSYANAVNPYLSRLTRRSAAVDVGAGSGPLLPWLCEEGFSPVIGIEPSRSAIEAASPSVRSLLREGLFSPELLSDTSPSFLCSFMTLEHMSDPGEFVKSAYALLEPGGMLAVVVHNWRAPLNRLLGLRSPIIDVEHLQLFSPKSLQVLFEKNGFKPVELEPIKNTYPLRYWIRLLPLPSYIKKTAIRLLEHLHLANAMISFRVGNILAVGFKPLDKQPS